MGLVVKDGNGNLVEIETNLPPGRAPGAASSPVVLSNEDKAAIDLIAAQLAGSLAITAAELPLPAGAATAAKQDAIVAAIENMVPGGGSGGDASALKQDEQTALLTAIDAKLAAAEYHPATQPVSGDVAIIGSVNVVGPLTNAQLRATPIEVDVAFPATQPVSGEVGIVGNVAVTGPLTDFELRASPIEVDVAFPATQPISAASLPLPAGAATAAKQDQLIAAIEGISPGGGSGGDASAANQATMIGHLSDIETLLGGTLTVTGPLTDAQLRAAPVPVSGEIGVTGSVAVTGVFWQATQPVSIAATVNVAGPLTDTQLRASAVPVSLADAVEVTGDFYPATQAVSAASLPLPAGAATNAKLDEVVVALADNATGADIATLLGAIAALTGSEYETVAAGSDEQVLGAAGAAGDLLTSLLVVPASTSPGAITIKDGAGTAITVFAGGADSIATLHPFPIPLGIRSAAGPWRVTTGANVSVVAAGNFS